MSSVVETFGLTNFPTVMIVVIVNIIGHAEDWSYLHQMLWLLAA